MIAALTWACAGAVACAASFVAGRLHVLAAGYDRAMAEEVRGELGATIQKLQDEQDLLCTDIGHANIMRDRALAEATTLRLQLAAAHAKNLNLRAAVTFWSGCFKAAHLAFLAVGAAQARLATAPADAAAIGRPAPAPHPASEARP